jgi:DNA-binding transcriptional MerR regulator
MTKQEFQQELKEKKEGTKLSDIKRLKRSKSADDISATPPSLLVNDQLKEKQKEVENLRKKLEDTNTKLTDTTEQLDNSLLARHKSLKD